jgi:hypothetical protein
VYAPHISISENGRPLCQANLEMIPNGRDMKRKDINSDVHTQ